MKLHYAIVPLFVAFAMPARAGVIAYDNAAVAENQDYGGSLGLDFNVNQPIEITALGAFDSGLTANLAGKNGTSGVTVLIYDRSTGTSVGSSVTFTSSNSGTAVNGDAFLSVSFVLAVGNYSVVAFNDINYNSGYDNPISPNPTSIENSDGTSISFVGSSRYSITPGVYPETIDGGPTNRYDAGTFEFTDVPEPASLLILGVALLTMGLVGVRRRDHRFARGPSNL